MNITISRQFHDVYLTTWPLKTPLTDQQVVSARTAVNGWLSRWATTTASKAIVEELHKIIDSKELGITLDSLLVDAGISMPSMTGFFIERWEPDDA